VGYDADYVDRDGSIGGLAVDRSEGLDEAYVPFFGAFGAAWDDAVVAHWRGNRRFPRTVDRAIMPP
jgi:hypothetical protein